MRVEIVMPVKRALAWWNRSRIGRTLSWYGAHNGSVLSGGIAYSALFSLFAGLTIGWTVFSRILGSNAGLRAAVLDQVDAWVPGLVGDGPRDLVRPDTLVLPSVITWASVAAAVVLLFSAIGVMGALRGSVREMFGLPATGSNALLVRLWQLAGFALLFVAMLVSAGASVAASSVGRVAASWFGGSTGLTWSVRAGGALIGVVIDALVVAGIITLVAGVHPPKRVLIAGSLIAGLVAGALRWAGTSVIVGSAASNTLIAPFAAIVTILLLVNFVARVLLYACAWMQAAEVSSLHEYVSALSPAQERHLRPGLSSKA